MLHAISDVLLAPLWAITKGSEQRRHKTWGSEIECGETNKRRVRLEAAQIVDVPCAWLLWVKAETEHLDQTKESCRTTVTRRDARNGKKLRRAMCAMVR